MKRDDLKKKEGNEKKSMRIKGVGEMI